MKDLYCLIGITLLIASIASIAIRKDSDLFIKFDNLLDQDQKIIYQKIVKERLMIYSYGVILGLGLGLFYYLSSKKDKFSLCKFLFIIYIVKFGFYYFYPKSPLMLYSLNTKEQIDTWADI